VASGDFDGDGRADLMTSFATHGSDNTARRGLELSRVNGAGEWTTELVAAYEGKDNMWSLDAGDLDGDGKLDLVATTERGKVLVLLGDGAGHFSREESPELDPPDLCRGYGLELGDVDGDGRAEIVAGFAGESATILEFLGQTKCEIGGSLRVWRASPRSSS
jgi:FG-GAP-like repeat